MRQLPPRPEERRDIVRGWRSCEAVRLRRELRKICKNVYAIAYFRQLKILLRKSCQSGTVMLKLWNPDSTSRIGSRLARYGNPEPGKPKSSFAATDSGCSTWFGRVYVNGEFKGNKPDSQCQPRLALLGGYQGRVIGDAQTARLSAAIAGVRAGRWAPAHWSMVVGRWSFGVRSRPLNVC